MAFIAHLLPVFQLFETFNPKYAIDNLLPAEISKQPGGIAIATLSVNTGRASSLTIVSDEKSYYII